MLLLEEVVHLLLGEVGKRHLVGVRRGFLSKYAALKENRALEGVCARMSLGLHVVDGITMFHIGIKSEDHLERCSPG